MAPKKFDLGAYKRDAPKKKGLPRKWGPLVAIAVGAIFLATLVAGFIWGWW